jgi:hypothetical protein
MATRVYEFVNIEYKVKDPPKSKRRGGVLATPSISNDNLINKNKDKKEIKDNIKISNEKQHQQQQKSTIKTSNENLKPIIKTPTKSNPPIVKFNNTSPRLSNENKYKNNSNNSNEFSPNKILPSKVKSISVSKRIDPHSKIPKDNLVKWIASGQPINRDFLTINTDLEINRIKNENNLIQKPISPRPSSCSNSKIRPKSGKCLRERIPHQTSGPVLRIIENKETNDIHHERWSKVVILNDPDERGKPQSIPDRGHESFQKILLQTKEIKKPVDSVFQLGHMPSSIVFK